MRLMYTHPSTGLAAIVIAAPKANLERVLGTLTEDAYMAHVIGKSLPKGVKEVIVLADDWKAPESRVFRNAWKIDGGQIKVCMDTAKGIQRDRVRQERASRFAPLDVDAMKAIGKEDKAALAEIEAKKQKLRDAPSHPAIDAASTPEALAAIKLDDLI